MDAALPGMGTEQTGAYRRILASRQGLQLLPGGIIISGAKSRDPLNTGYLHTLRAGMLMGRLPSRMYAPSIIGKLTAAGTAAGATITVSTATGVELDRRVGAGGIFKVVGPPTIGGTVAVLNNLSYSGTAAAGTVTLAANSAVAEVQTITLDALATAGTYTISYKGEKTSALAYNAAVATTVTQALDALPNTTVGDIIASGDTFAAGSAAMIFTFANTLGDVAPLEVDITSLTGPTTATNVETTKGELVGAATLGADAVLGSLLMAADGSEAPLGLIGKGDGIKVTDELEVNANVQLAEFIVAGNIDATQIINYPTDPTLIAWLKAQMRLNGGGWLFDDDFLS